MRHQPSVVAPHLDRPPFGPVTTRSEHLESGFLGGETGRQTRRDHRRRTPARVDLVLGVDTADVAIPKAGDAVRDLTHHHEIRADTDRST